MYGENIIAVKVISTDNIERTYQIKVTREKSNEARLSMLSVTDHMIDPTFNMDTKTYSLETNKSSLDINDVPLDKDATYVILGNEKLVNGINSIIIRVTAQDRSNNMRL